MKLKCFLILLVVFAGVAPAFPQPELTQNQSKIYHGVFDIDWTIVSPIEESQMIRGDWRYLKIQGECYRVADWLGETMSFLSRQPNVKISFFSGGTAARNLELLNAIKPPVLAGKSLNDIRYKLLSREDLTEINPGSRDFSKRFQKSILKISSDVDNVVIVEDQFSFIHHSEANGIWLRKTYNFYETYADAIQAKRAGESKYIPLTRQDWLDDRNRLAGVVQIFADSLGELTHAEHPSHLSLGKIVSFKAKRNRHRYIERGMETLRAMQCSADLEGTSN